MKLIYPPTVAVWGVCGRQKYDPAVSYRLSKYAVRVDCDGGVLLYQTFTGAMVLLENGETAEENTEELIGYRFLVPVGFDEKQYTDKVRAILSTLLTGRKKKTAFTVLPTTDCNARCFYCYQKGCRHLTMNGQIAAAVADYIARVSGGEEVKLSWFGGEPLCGVKAIDRICSDLRDQGVAYHSQMTSNGYLFTPEIVARATELWNLKSVQITIDGTKEVYQRIKAYPNGDENAFERVLENIACLADHGVKVVIRMNMDSSNAEDLLSLADALGERFRTKSCVSAYPVLLKTFVDSVAEFDSLQAAIDAYTRLNKRLKDAGLVNEKKLRREMPLHRCMADNDACEVILPDGSIERCEHFNSEPVGTVFTFERDEKLIAAWKEQYTCAACEECALYPRCIELKKCAWAKDGCPETVRTIRLMNLKDAVLAAYRKAEDME